MRLWALATALIISEPAWGRTFTTRCEGTFAIDAYHIVSQAEVLNLFFKEYKTLDTDGPIRLQDLSIRSMSDESPLVALSDFSFDQNYVYHELKSSDTYARRVLSAKNEQLLFISKYGSLSVPGFDGIVYSASGMPVANYTLKSTRGSWWKPLSLAIEKAISYSKDERQWFNIVTASDFDKSPTFFFLRNNWPRFYKNTFEKAVYLTKLLGVNVSKCKTCEVRKTRVVIDLVKHDVGIVSREDIQSIQQTLVDSSPYIESVTFLGPGRALEISENQFKFF